MHVYTQKSKVGETGLTLESNLLTDHGSSLVVKAFTAYFPPLTIDAYFNPSACVCTAHKSELILDTWHNCIVHVPDGSIIIILYWEKVAQ